MKKVIIALLVCVLSFTFTACQGASTGATNSTNSTSSAKTAISFGTMQAGTSTYTVGAALASIWNSKLNFTVTQQPMQVTGPAFRLLKKDQLDIAITTLWAIHAAYTGEDPFWDKWALGEVAPVPIQQLCMGGDMAYGFFTTDPSIKSLSDLAGKKIYITQNGGENDIQAKALLEAAGVAYKDVTDIEFSSIAEVQQGLKEGLAVAVYWTANTWIQDVATTKKMYAINITPEEVAKLNELLPGWGFIPDKIEEGSYGLSNGGGAFAVPFGIYVREGVDEQTAYGLVKTMYENYDELVKLNPKFLTKWSLDRAVMTISAPIHPGAIKYYKEAGVWTDKQEAANEALKAYKRRVK